MANRSDRLSRVVSSGALGIAVVAVTQSLQLGSSVLCYWIRGNFWVATVIAFSIQWPGSGVVHIVDIVVSANYAPNDAGLPIYLVILMPLIVIGLLVYY